MFRIGVAYVVASWLALQVLDLVFENIGAPDWVMQAIMTLLALGFPVALLFAWAFEMTPEGLKRESEVDRSSSITPQTGQKLDRLIIVFLVGIIAVMALQQFRSPSVGEREGSPSADPASADATEAQRSIAVLPFADLSESQDQFWFGDGLSEEILNALMRTPDLLVASRTSSFKYKNTDKDIREIGTELGVVHVLEGSVRRAGDKVRVTAQLIRASDGFHVWSQNYDREIRDVIAIQEDLAIEIARALKTSLDPVALASMMQSGTRSIEAYQHYLNALAMEAQASATGDTDLYQQSYESLEQARAVDPGFAAAHARSAQYWDEQLRRISRWTLDTGQNHEQLRRNFEDRIGAAIEHATDPVSRMSYEGRLAITRIEVRDAIALMRETVEHRPNDANAWDLLMRAASLVHDRETLEFVRDRAQELSKVNPDIGALASMAAFVLQDPGAAEVARTVLGHHPYHREVVYQSHRALLAAGEVEEAARLIPLMRDDGWFPTARIRQACAEGNRDLAEQIAAESAPTSRSGNWHANMLLGRHDEAVDYIRSIYDSELLYVAASWLLYPHFDPSPFPELLAALERENSERRAPAVLRYFCPPGD